MYRLNWNGVVFSVTNIGGGILKEEISSHSHALGCYELHFIIGGEGRVIASGKEYPLKGGDMFITGPNVYHSQPADGMEDIVIMLKADKTKGALPFCRIFLNTGFFKIPDFNMQTVKRIYFEHFQNSEDKETAVSALCALLLTEITRRLSGGGEYTKAENENLNDRRFVIIENYFLFGKDYNLSELADKIGLCERQTQRLLKKYYGKTFREKKKESLLASRV